MARATGLKQSAPTHPTIGKGHWVKTERHQRPRPTTAASTTPPPPVLGGGGGGSRGRPQKLLLPGKGPGIFFHCAATSAMPAARYHVLACVCVWCCPNTNTRHSRTRTRTAPQSGAPPTVMRVGSMLRPTPRQRSAGRQAGCFAQCGHLHECAPYLRRPNLLVFGGRRRAGREIRQESRHQGGTGVGSAFLCAAAQ